MTVVVDEVSQFTLPFLHLAPYISQRAASHSITDFVDTGNLAGFLE
jgi:hypothetical protein